MTATDRLYDLLPALHRQRDIDEGRPLQALLRVITEQADIVRQNVDRLWDDEFIETCQPWVIPYIGDLVANRPLHDVDGRRRVDVARTIYYRRRKGTLPMLEELARDVTGWGVHGVEFFELLGWTQHLDHLRFQAGTADVRDIDRMDRVDGPFDVTSHSVDVRPPSPVDGWHAIRTIGFFIYRLRSFPLQGTVLTDTAGDEHAVRPAARVLDTAPHLFHVSSLGAPAPLFNRWRTEGDDAGLTTEPFMPCPIRPLAFLRDLERLDTDPDAVLDYYGAAGRSGASTDVCDTARPTVEGGSLAVYADGALVDADRILCKDLSTWQAPASGSPTVAVDVRLGRIAFAPDGAPAEVTVEYHYGLAGPIGGGPYDRRRPDPTAPRFAGWGPDTVADPGALGPEPIPVSALVSGDNPHHPTIELALDEWAGAETPVVIEINDDRTYEENVVIPVDSATRVVLQAANERRPTLVGTVTITGTNPEARVVLDGLVIEGHVAVTGTLRELRLAHCTVVPGRALDTDGRPPEAVLPAVEVAEPNTALRVVIDSCIVGPVRTPVEVAGITIDRSIVDGVGTGALARTGGDDQSAGPTTLRQVTMFGTVHVRALELASEVVCTAPMTVERTQTGCVRFSYVEPGSVTPRRHRCQPDLALADEDLDAADRDRITARLKPTFTSTRFHDPGYAQLGRSCPVEIATGAEDGAEMGVWAWLRNPQREANLRLRLDEYLPFGLDPALLYVT